MHDESAQQLLSDLAHPSSAQDTARSQSKLRTDQNYAAGLSKEAQAERAYRNFAARKGPGKQEGERETAGAAERSADSSMERYVREGVKSAHAVADNSIRTHLRKFAVSLLLSLSEQQLAVLQRKQLALGQGLSEEHDPLFLSN